MSTIAFKVHRKSGEYVTTTVVPSNHSEEPQVSWWDGVIVAVLLLSVAGLIYLLAAG